MMSFVKSSWRGILLCAALAVPSWVLGLYIPVVGGPVFAILAGMAMALATPPGAAFQAGVHFTSKKILQYAVILLGFGMNLSDILEKGRQSLPVIITTIAASLVIAFVLQRALRIPPRIATLVGVGSSICGGSAVAAAAPVIGADDEEIAQSISVIFLFNVAAALLFPTLGSVLGLSNEGFGLFAGTAVNDTSSVTAAAAAWDGIHASNTLEAATIVKLTRTLAIIPITLALAFYRTRTEKAGKSSVSLRKIFPFFILFFVLASVATTVFQLPAGVTSPLKALSKFFIVMAMAAIGLNTNLVRLVKSGGKPILMGFCCWAGIALVSLAMQRVLGIW